MLNELIVSFADKALSKSGIKEFAERWELLYFPYSKKNYYNLWPGFFLFFYHLFLNHMRSKVKILQIFLFLIVVIIIGCSTNGNKKEILVYFPNSYFNDGPIKWPDFTSYEKLQSESIKELNDVRIPVTKFSWIKDILFSNIKNNRLIGESNSIDGSAENIFLIFEKKDSIYFDKNNNFFNPMDDFLFKSKTLADSIKSLINYAEYFQGHENTDATIYSKIKIRAYE